MNIVTSTEAVQVIDSNEFVGVFWAMKGCPGCVHFTEVLEEISIELEDWVFVKVILEDEVERSGRKSALFQPDNFPICYFFKNGERVLVGKGVAPKEDVSNTLRDISSGTYKTPSQVEQEMLDALDE